VFIYSQSKPLDTLPSLHFQTPWNVTYLTLHQFFQLNNNSANQSESEKEYHYFTGCLARSEDSLVEFPFAKDASPIDFFIANKDFYAVNLWYEYSLSSIVLSGVIEYLNG